LPPPLRRHPRSPLMMGWPLRTKPFYLWFLLSIQNKDYCMIFVFLKCHVLLSKEHFEVISKHTKTAFPDLVWYGHEYQDTNTGLSHKKKIDDIVNVLNPLIMSDDDSFLEQFVLTFAIRWLRSQKWMHFLPT
jgi:hypothetical protein